MDLLALLIAVAAFVVAWRNRTNTTTNVVADEDCGCSDKVRARTVGELLQALRMLNPDLPIAPSDRSDTRLFSQIDGTCLMHCFAGGFVCLWCTDPC